MEPLRTPRLIVRPFAESDLADFLAYQSLPAVRRFLPGEAMSQEKAARYLAGQAAMRGDEKGAWHGFAVEHTESGRVIGDVGVFLQREPADEGDVGFQFHPDYHGQAYAAEATRALLGHVFGTLGLRRATAHGEVENAASYRLMARLGMRPFDEPGEGLAFALTRDEWIAQIP